MLKNANRHITVPQESITDKAWHTPQGIKKSQYAKHYTFT